MVLQTPFVLCAVPATRDFTAEPQAILMDLHHVSSEGTRVDVSVFAICAGISFLICVSPDVKFQMSLGAEYFLAKGTLEISRSFCVVFSIEAHVQC